MPVFRLLDKDFELSDQELATAPQSFLAEAAACAEPGAVIEVNTWKEAKWPPFQASLAACFEL